jgi:hypothetical protein
MRIFESYMGSAWLLSKDGTEIEVYKHPNERIEFDSIVDLVNEYGGKLGKRIVNDYLAEPNEINKTKVMDIYNNNWCKVRTWGTFGEELTFRITSTNFNWYNTIIEFLLRHKRTNQLITVETVKNGNCKIYWDKITYADAINPENQMILESKLPFKLMIREDEY